MQQRHDESTTTPRSGARTRYGTLVLVCTVLMAEAAALVGVLDMATGPATAQAGDAMTIDEAGLADRVVETLVLDARLENDRSGVTNVFDTEIWVQTRARHQDQVNLELERIRNELRADIMAIWKSSQPRHLREPELDTVTRRIQTSLAARFGVDEASGEPIIRKCVIVAGTGFRADG
jgi:hypothetical protein